MALLGWSTDSYMCDGSSFNFAWVGLVMVLRVVYSIEMYNFTRLNIFLLFNWFKDLNHEVSPLMIVCYFFYFVNHFVLTVESIVNLKWDSFQLFIFKFKKWTRMGLGKSNAFPYWNFLMKWFLIKSSWRIGKS